mmetsp:Transcript_30763/g.70049  ORF Transcript_30763/g.70049 Transcript_30763/m.70049 type:complete len:110 (+) Transcript_30763:449-778(+)
MHWTAPKPVQIGGSGSWRLMARTIASATGWQACEQATKQSGASNTIGIMCKYWPHAKELSAAPLSDASVAPKTALHRTFATAIPVWLLGLRKEGELTALGRASGLEPST